MLYVWLFKKDLLHGKNNPLLQAGSEGDLPHLSCSLVAHQHMDISKEKTESTLILSFLHNFQTPYMMMTTTTLTTSLKSRLYEATRTLLHVRVIRHTFCCLSFPCLKNKELLLYN